MAGTPLDEYGYAQLAGRVAALAHLFRGEPLLDTPLWGRTAGPGTLAQVVKEASEWLKERDARAEEVASTRVKGRIVQEVVLHLRQQGKDISLPVALVADLVPGGISALRVYHSCWPLEGSHRVRPPLLECSGHVDLPGAVGSYHQALREGDLKGMLSQFEETGYAREPAGGEYVYRGVEGLRRFYGLLFSGGGIQLEHCTSTDDGVRCALEYNAVRWGQTELHHQAGVAVYERGASGLLVAARIYDDVDPPLG